MLILNFIVITMQYALGKSPNLRTNVDCVFILRENLSTIENDYDHYAGMLRHLRCFVRVMDQCTENFECSYQ